MTKLILQRGEKSWAYLYIVLGLALAVEGSIIQMISPLLFPYNLVVFSRLAQQQFG